MSNEIVVSQRNPYEPTTLAEGMQLAKMLSGAAVIPTALVGKPADVLAIVMKGRELGLSPMQSLGGISIVKGKPILEASLMVGLVLQHHEICEHFTLTESTEITATYRTKRRGAPVEVEMSFTIEEAKRAGLTGKDNWRNFPAAMLRARASAALARAVYPDLVAGIYVPGEIPESERPEPRDVTHDVVIERNSKGVPGSSPGPVAGAGDRGSVSPSPEASGSQHSEFHRPEFSPEDTAKQDKLAALKRHQWPSGPDKGQFVEASSVETLTKRRDHLVSIKSKDAATIEACSYWIEIKSAPGYVAPGEASDADEDFAPSDAPSAAEIAGA